MSCVIVCFYLLCVCVFGCVCTYSSILLRLVCRPTSLAQDATFRRTVDDLAPIDFIFSCIFSHTRGTPMNAVGRISRRVLAREPWDMQWLLLLHMQSWFAKGLHVCMQISADTRMVMSGDMSMYVITVSCPIIKQYYGATLRHSEALQISHAQLLEITGEIYHASVLIKYQQICIQPCLVF